MRYDSIWTPVTTAFPEQHRRVLVVCFNPQNHSDRHVAICEYWGQDKQTGRHIWSGGKHVSYWAEIPEMPEESDAEREHREKVTIDTLRKMYSEARRKGQR